MRYLKWNKKRIFGFCTCSSCVGEVSLPCFPHPAIEAEPLKTLPVSKMLCAREGLKTYIYTTCVIAWVLVSPPKSIFKSNVLYNRLKLGSFQQFIRSYGCHHHKVVNAFLKGLSRSVYSISVYLFQLIINYRGKFHLNLHECP